MDTRALKAFAAEIGFDRLGITTAAPPQDGERYLQWIENGFAADLWYLKEEKRVQKRLDLSKILPGVRTVIVGAISYAPATESASTDAKFGRYGWGKDYHVIVKEKLEALANWLRTHSNEPFSYLTYTDTGPILERSLAERAGIGWIGKNTLVMSEKTGSYIYLGELLTTLSLPIDAPAIHRCGTCTRCLEACPTQALVAPFQLDANRCISYQTLENRKSDIPDNIRNELQGWVAGCDICQEVCPWNKEPLPLRIEAFQRKPHVDLTTTQIHALTKEDFSQLFQETTFHRIGLQTLQRNASR